MLLGIQITVPADKFHDISPTKKWPNNSNDDKIWIEDPVLNSGNIFKLSQVYSRNSRIVGCGFVVWH